MKTKLSTFLAGAISLAMVSAPARAHHGYAAYEMNTNMSLKGTITNFAMANPHSQISFDVKGASGELEHWAVETGAPVRGMKAGGWSSDSLKPGDVVTVNFHPAKTGIHAGVLMNVVWSDGHVLPQRNAGGDSQPGN
jgi:prepilin-type processing-associated H-X9-DG protein